MQVLDTLQILIEADSKGLQTQLIRAYETTKKFVGSMNSQEVNWKTILTRTISPAIISGVAAMFATAITRTLSFQQAIQDSSAKASSSFGNNIGQISKEAISLSNATGQSANDVGGALAYASRQFKDSATAQLVTKDASILATMGFGNLNDIVKILSVTLQQWGITTSDSARKALDELYSGFKNSKLSFNDFASTISEIGPLVRNKIKFGEATADLAAFSNEAGQTAESAKTIFSEVAKAIANPLSNATLLANSMGDFNKKVKDKGILGGIEAISKSLKGPAIQAQALGQAMGLTVDNIQRLKRIAPDVFAKLESNSAGFQRNIKAVNQEFKQTTAGTRELQLAWNQFMNTFTQAGQKMQSVLASLISGDWGKQIGEYLKGASQINEAISKKNMSKANIAAESPIKKLLMSSGLGFSSSAIQGIMKKGEGGNAIGDLLNALSGHGASSNFSNTFNITNPQGGEGLTADNIVKKLYNQFMNK